MKQSVKIILAAAMLAMPPSAVAEENTAQIAGGALLTVAGGFLIVDARDDADEEATACAIRNPGTTCSESAFSASPAKAIGGVLGAVGGVGLIVNGLTGDNAFTRNGLSVDGLTLGYTDTGRVGLQKKWEF